jgi:hypothetical protein
VDGSNPPKQPVGGEGAPYHVVSTELHRLKSIGRSRRVDDEETLRTVIRHPAQLV